MLEFHLTKVVFDAKNMTYLCTYFDRGFRFQKVFSFRETIPTLIEKSIAEL